MLSNIHNFCGGNYDDWLEIMLTEKCNGGCVWCVEKKGYHPKQHVSTTELAAKIISYKPSRFGVTETGKTNVILLGGEPTLYKEMRQLITGIREYVNIYVTTNGSMLNNNYIKENLVGIKGINISIHHYDLSKNKEITDINLEQETLEYAIVECRQLGIVVRFNCNLISSYIDSEDEILKYIQWAKETGADKIRFAELKGSEDEFVDLAKILNHKYGTNDNPYVDGCNKDAIINGICVNFRQMCGLQTNRRKAPINPKTSHRKVVLYYDGVFYDGWQTHKSSKGDKPMKRKELKQLIVDELEPLVEELVDKIGKRLEKEEFRSLSSKSSITNSGCRY